MLQNLNPIQAIRERIGAAIAVFVMTACCFFSGVLMAFVVSPQQAVEWRQVQNLPETTAASFQGLPAGEELVFTGTLADNPTLREDYVLYRISIWDVECDQVSNDGSTTTECDGSWDTQETNIPALTVQVSDGTLTTTPGGSIRLDGNLPEQITDSGDGRVVDGRAEGSTRVQGMRNGDTITVLGQRGAGGDVVPERIFAGDRVELVETIRSGARAAFIIGIVLMVFSPVFLVIGLFAAVFGRRR